VSWLLNVLNDLGVQYSEQPSVALGVRVEEQANRLIKLTRRSLNPKILISRRGRTAETFCWCANGGVLEYEMNGVRILDGEHRHENPSQNTSFGIIVTSPVPRGVSTAGYSLDFAERINAHCGGAIGVQRLEDFRQNRISSRHAIESNPVCPTLPGARPSNLTTAFPPDLVAGVLALVDQINDECPDGISPNALLYAPIVERIFPDVNIGHDCQTATGGIFLAGDCSGKAIGVVPSTTMGTQIARCLAAEMQG
jgi:uncharacterized FAD-dependent dehydrogenase